MKGDERQQASPSSVVCTWNVDTTTMHETIENSKDGQNGSSASPTPDNACLVRRLEFVTEKTTVEENDTVNATFPIHETRDLILKLTVITGRLCSLFLTHVPHDGSSASFLACSEMEVCMSQLLATLVETSKSLSIEWKSAVLKKLALNRQKYPKELCKGKRGKYTNYSAATGITKEDGQSTLHIDASEVLSGLDALLADETNDQESFSLLVQKLTEGIREFAYERDWTRYHKPRNLVLALLGELGELSEILQWKEDCSQELSIDELDKLGQEIADVSIYLLRLADVCGVKLNVLG